MTTVLILKRVKGHTPIARTVMDIGDEVARDWIAKGWAAEITPSEATTAQRVENTMLNRERTRGNGRCRT